MLVLGRRNNQSLVLHGPCGERLRIVVVAIEHMNKVRIGFDGPREWIVKREELQSFEELPASHRAMAGLFHFASAMSDGVSVNDLSQVMAAAIEDGHDMLEVELTMALHALQLSQQSNQEESGDPS